MENLNYIKRLILAAFVFISPIFFLTTTAEFYMTNKFYLLVIFSFVLIAINAVEIFLRRKAKLLGSPLDLPLGLFLLAISLSVIFSSTNKVQALLSMNLGLIPLLFIFIFYLFVSRSDEKTKMLIDKVLLYSSSLASLLAIFFYFQPLANVTLPASFQFLKLSLFTPLGGLGDLAVFLAFSITYRVVKKKFTIAEVVMLSLNVLALGLAVYYLFKPNSVAWPPYRLSWYAGIEILKNPLTAAFGIGLGNFPVIFTKVKDVLYNQSPLWIVNNFSISSSMALHILTEAGLLALASFIFVLYSALRQTAKDENRLSRLIIIVWIILSLVFPISFYTLFLFFLALALINKNHVRHEVTLDEGFPAFILAIFLMLAFVVGFGYYLGRVYVAEYYFKRSLDGLVANNVKEVYDNMRNARIFNPYSERFILNFSQTNLIIANNLSQKEDLTENDRQTIARAIQAAISEAKQLIKLNPNNAQYWENLANTYRTMIPLAEGADAWTISSYQRAIILDPQNPSYRLSLGSVYYLLKRYDQAITFFEQAVALKPDWSNGYYNLAWTYYQNKDYEKATLAMQNVVNLTDKTNNFKDWEKANTDLEQFKKQLPLDEEKSATGSGQLNLPETVPTIEPKIELPKEASPEAR